MGTTGSQGQRKITKTAKQVQHSVLCLHIEQFNSQRYHSLVNGHIDLGKVFRMKRHFKVKARVFEVQALWNILWPYFVYSIFAFGLQVAVPLSLLAKCH